MWALSILKIITIQIKTYGPSSDYTPAAVNVQGTLQGSA